MTILRSRSIKSLFIALASTALAFALLSISPTQAHASTSDTIYGYAWSPNIGWISMNNCTSAGACTPVTYGVTMPTTGSIRNLSGYGWSSNVGWVSFNSKNPDGTAGATSGCPTFPDNPNCQAQVNWDSGEVSGWARACSVFASGCSGPLKNDGVGNDIYRGTWDGFISLADTNQGDRAVFGVSVDVASGTPARFAGFAWGADVVGWVDFSGVTYDPHIYECSDTVDNLDSEDQLADAADRGCHWDFDVNNPDSYEPMDPNESDSICPEHTYPDDPVQPKNCYYCPNLPGGPYTSLPAGYHYDTDGISCITGDPTCPPGQHVDPVTHLCVADPVCPSGQHVDPVTHLCVADPVCPAGQVVDPITHLCVNICPPGQTWDPRANACITSGPACDPSTATCPAGGQCSNIPDDVEIALGVGVPPTRPYRALPDGRCLCVAGYVLNGEYKCVKPTYCELGGNCN